MPGRTTKVEFDGSLGEKLAAGLEMPAGVPTAYALFAHCFTCSKDLFAARAIARELTRYGIAVLRFDFTGLGASEGDFANTNFSSNVGDLIAAADYLRNSHQAPQILIGHSLGGAAVLAAAGSIPEVNAVATIGAPADIAHVAHNFAGALEEIDADGKAHVQLAGRSFTITKQFLDDIRSTVLRDHVAALKRPLLVFHAPLDETVGIDNASAIFAAAKHPKSFVSLDSADHLLSRKQDASYVATVLAAWVSRYVSPVVEQADDVIPDNVTRVSETGQGKFQQMMTTGPHCLVADEPASVGGNDSGPTPYDLLSMALGACTSMTLRMYADHKRLELPRVTVDVSHDKVHARDCQDCGQGKQGRIDRFERVISVAGGIGALPPEVQDKLVEIAGKCPVHRTLEASSAVVTKLAPEDP